MISRLLEEQAEKRTAAATTESRADGDGRAVPLTDEELAAVSGGYIGETEKNLPPRF
jgi:bacteriocin-like protein